MPHQSEPPLWQDSGAWSQTVLDTLSLEEKVAQMIVPAVHAGSEGEATANRAELESLARDLGVGGFTVLSGTPRTQVRILNHLQSVAPLPLLISQDQEWGAGMRLDGATIYPRAMALGAARDPQLTYAMGRAIAREARALGVHQNYAPVADVNNNPDNPIINVRSFGEHPDLVADLATAYATGLQDGGVIATAKHFPGHGDTQVDSHAGLPVLPFSRARLKSIELRPFQQLIDAGVQSVMVGHLALPRVTNNQTVPASLSPTISSKLLRTEMEFDGLIVTDALNMDGVAGNRSPGDVAVEAVEAGADLILMPRDPTAAHQALVTAADTGRLDPDVINRSVERILRAKEHARLPQNRTVDESRMASATGRPYQKALSKAIAREGLTLLENTHDLLPLYSTDSHKILSITLDSGSDPDVGQTFTHRLDTLNQNGRVTHRKLYQGISPASYNAVLREAPSHDLVVVSAFHSVRAWSGNIGFSSRERTFLNRLLALETPIVLVSFGSPYLVKGIPMPAAYLCGYSEATSVQKAAAEAIFGQVTVSGRLPITVNREMSYGDGLELDQNALRQGWPEEVGMDSQVLSKIDSLINGGINERAFPGAAVVVGRAGVVTKMENYGYHTYDRNHPVTPRSIYDLASLSKVIGTTSAVMKLYEEGRLDLDAPVTRYWPAFGQNGKEDVTIRHLLSHTSGLRGYEWFYDIGYNSRSAVLSHIAQDSLLFKPGSEQRYSDLGMIVLGHVIQRITGRSLNQYVNDILLEPLEMDHSGYRPLRWASKKENIVPTELDTYFRHRLIHGEVHDETAYIMGGVAGHAGLFSTAEDLARFAYLLINGGSAYGQELFQEETVDLFTRPHRHKEFVHALGWDTRATADESTAGRMQAPESFGHNGFTGTSFWVDPESDTFIILLTNRVYPTRKNGKIKSIREEISKVVMNSIKGPAQPLLPFATRFP